LGEKPLTGAQKQKRHREKVKAKLAEAQALKARADSAPGDIPGLKTFYLDLLRELGASAEEAKQICEAAASLQEDIVAALRKRGQAALEALRRRPQAGSSLLARLAAMQDQR
jgi:tRNA A37 threonylcarbamoyltransferase TsaD